MSSGAKTVLVFLTVICGLILVTLGLCLEWSGWGWASLAVLLPGAPTLLLKAADRRARPVPVEMEPFLPALPVERREERVTDVALPSCWGDYDFRFSATVRWYPTGETAREPVINPAGLAVDAVLARACDITVHREPGRASLVQHELNGALGRMRPDATGFLQVMAESVTLVLAPHDQERLEKLAAVRKDKAVWEHQRKHEQSKREYLGKDVFKDTGSAVVWWLARNGDKVDKTVDDLGILAQLASAANDTDVPERLAHLVPRPAPPEPVYAGVPLVEDPGTCAAEPPRTATDHYDAFLDAIRMPDGDVRRRLFTRQFADLLESTGRGETAEALRQMFDAVEEPEYGQKEGEDGA
jgi:hypothetical protein